MYIGERLRKLRIDSGILQKDLAEKLKLSQQTISLYEANKRQPDYSTLIIMADFYDVSTDYILGITNIRKRVDFLVEDSTRCTTDKVGIKYIPKERFEIIKIIEELYTLSPESKKEVLRYIKMLQLWNQDKDK